MKADYFRSILDKVGATASTLCAVHCIAMPFLLTILPLFGLSFLLDENLEKIFVSFSVILAVFNTCWGYKVHKKNRVLFLSLSGGTMLLLATFFFAHTHLANHHGHQHIEAIRIQESPLNLGLLILGALMVAGGHLLNRHFCHQCRECSHEGCES